MSNTMHIKISCCLIVLLLSILQVKTQVYIGAGASGSAPLNNTTQDIGAGIGPFGEIGYRIKKFEFSTNIDKIYYSSIIPGYSLNLYAAQLSLIPFDLSIDMYGGIGIGYAQERIKIDFADETITNGSLLIYPEIGLFKDLGKENQFKLKLFINYIYIKPENNIHTINLGLGIFYKLLSTQHST